MKKLSVGCTAPPVAFRPVADLLALRCHEIPLSAKILDVLTGGFARSEILGEMVERPAIIGDLLGAGATFDET
ncbi:hypothetical protein AUC71_05310 [Methyloceanibacter marginalis]|uniref:Uncharacterized protein n=1 Tax=Methyloceanibacter marginalis TaxID=1774971 RepID=A0A1E3VIH4_9HYPH|nr:hypothetical protein AUC71_05310 [Methyloceanibacter marginalis]